MPTNKPSFAKPDQRAAEWSAKRDALLAESKELGGRRTSGRGAHSKSG